MYGRLPVDYVASTGTRETNQSPSHCFCTYGSESWAISSEVEDRLNKFHIIVKSITGLHVRHHSDSKLTHGKTEEIIEEGRNAHNPGVHQATTQHGNGGWMRLDESLRDCSPRASKAAQTKSGLS